ncbi:MAG: hypothetical protein ACE5FA_01555 [Dehalococcoidia bacterium]
MRFQIRVDPVWRPFVLIGGATRENSYVEVTDEGITVCFGLLFKRTIPFDDVKDVFARSWPLWYGIGWRSNLRGVIGLVGSYSNVVEIRLNKRGRAWRVLPCDRVCVSLEDPDGFIAAVKGEKEPPAAEKKTAAPKRKRKTPAKRRPSRKSDATK